MTLGPALLALSMLGGHRTPQPLHPLLVFGRSSLTSCVLQSPAARLAPWTLHVSRSQPRGWDRSLDVRWLSYL